jgi:hypothetical protein
LAAGNGLVFHGTPVVELIDSYAGDAGLTVNVGTRVPVVVKALFVVSKHFRYNKTEVTLAYKQI